MSTALLESPARVRAGVAAPTPASSPRPRRLSATEYLALDEAAERRSELIEGEMFPMAGASRTHSRIATNLSYELESQLLDEEWDLFSSETRVGAGIGYYYPDLGIVGGEYLVDPLNRNTLTNPVVLVEILSPSTMHVDHGVKLRDYLRLPSLRTYLIVSQNTPFVQQYERGSDTGTWQFTAHDGLGEMVELPAIGCHLPLSAIYRRVVFTETEADSDESAN